MAFISTRGGIPPTGLKEALQGGLAPDGGLYMPRSIPQLAPEVLLGLQGRSWADQAAAVLGPVIENSMDVEALRCLAASALDFPIPLVSLRPGVFVLELFRGPTLAFKDVGARFLARFVDHFREEQDPVTTILTATSGDTGGAVAHAFHGLPGTRVVVLFPKGRVTRRQERQFSTLGGNVRAVEVEGDFDDCQRLAKEAFRAQETRTDSVRGSRVRLTSANSINVGRFLPQITYFFRLWDALQELVNNRTRILVSVPSGNFGNLAAGLLARAMGASGLFFLAATNENDVVLEYLRTGVFRSRPAVPTLSTAMDVGNPSNLERILHLSDGRWERVRREVAGRKVTDRETADCIRRTYLETGYVMDPHAAVGLAALEAEMEWRPGLAGVVLATAHPAKFSEVVEPLLDIELAIPQEILHCLEGERQVVSIHPRLEALMEVLDPSV